MVNPWFNFGLNSTNTRRGIRERLHFHKYTIAYKVYMLAGNEFKSIISRPITRAEKQMSSVIQTLNPESRNCK